MNDMRIHFALITVWTMLGALAARADETWRYVAPPADDAFANPPPRTLALSNDKPDDLKENVAYRGKQRRYAQLTYGVGRTAQAIVVLDDLGDRGFDLYVDANRDRTIDEKERSTAAGTNWRVELPVTFGVGELSTQFPRTVLFRYGAVTRTLAVATCGYIEGTTTIDDKPVRVRRIDGDCNGLFADSRDRLWIDGNGDGQWDAQTEQHLFSPILNLDRRRFAVKADSRGERLQFAPLNGLGRLQVRLADQKLQKAVTELQVTVQSRDGVVASLRALDDAVEVPVGEYRISSVLATLNDPSGGPTWGFVFTDSGGREPVWRSLAQNATLVIDPLAKFDFGLEAPDECQAGESIRIQPTLYTDEGLRIERAYRGVFQSFASGCHGDICLIDGEGNAVATASSGFA